jgi:signal transduction histidine kinase
VIVTEHTDRVLLVNPAMEHLFNIRSSQVIGRPVGRVLPTTELVAALTGQEIPQKMLEVPVENSGTWSANISTITSQNGQTMGRVAVLHDITALKEVDELKSEFVQTVSHDLRSPLTYLRGYATMLQTSEDGFQHQRHDEFVAKILQGIDQMEAMVSNLLNLSSIEAGVDLTMVDIEVSQLVAGVYADFVKPAEDAGLNLRMQVPSNLPPVVGDTTLLREALGNFIGNAIKYAPNSGDLTIRATLRPARGDAPAKVVIGVEDHGPGVAAKDLGLLFDKFYRVRSRETARVKGNGLGLAIVSKIAERHGGHAWAESDEGQGTTFYFSLPAKISVSNGQVKEPA